MLSQSDLRRILPMAELASDILTVVVVAVVVERIAPMRLYVDLVENTGGKSPSQGG
jgi:hypothetical protein